MLKKPNTASRTDNLISLVEQDMQRLPVPTLESSVPPTPPLPAYVDHLEGVPRVGALTAEAVIQDYENTAKHITELGEEIANTARRCQDYLAELKDLIADIDGIARKYRERGAEIFREIERSALMTQEVRKAANEMSDKVVQTSSQPT